MERAELSASEDFTTNKSQSSVNARLRQFLSVLEGTEFARFLKQISFGKIDFFTACLPVFWEQYTRLLTRFPEATDFRELELLLREECQITAERIGFAARIRNFLWQAQLNRATFLGILSNSLPNFSRFLETISFRILGRKGKPNLAKEHIVVCGFQSLWPLAVLENTLPTTENLTRYFFGFDTPFSGWKKAMGLTNFVSVRATQYLSVDDYREAKLFHERLSRFQAQQTSLSVAESINCLLRARFGERVLLYGRALARFLDASSPSCLVVPNPELPLSQIALAHASRSSRIVALLGVSEFLSRGQKEADSELSSAVQVIREPLLFLHPTETCSRVTKTQAEGATVLFASQGISENRELLPLLIKVLHGFPRVSLKIRPHPVESKWLLKCLFRGVPVSREEPLREALCSADILVTHSSTVALEAVCCGCPTILLTRNNIPPFPALIAAGAVSWANSEESLGSGIAALLFDEEYRRRQSACGQVYCEDLKKEEERTGLSSPQFWRTFLGK